jgi:AcrR family transcriptional regulator
MNKKIRSPVQKRSIKTKNKIIDAAEYLFSKKGFYKINSKDIAKHAGVAIGSFYAYFNDKKEVLIEALNRYNEKVFLNVKEFQENIKLEEKNPRLYIYEIIDNVINAHGILPEFHEEINFLMHTDPDIKKIMEKYQELSVNVAFNLLNKIKKNLKIKDIDTAAKLITLVIEEVAHIIVFDNKKYDKDKLIKELADMINHYLF